VLTLENSNGYRVTLLETGGAVQSIMMPDRHGRFSDIVLGYDDPAMYPGHSCFGAFVGRYANRIGGGSFVLNGKTYPITRNEGRNTLHGGYGYHLRNWDLSRTDYGALLTILDQDGQEGFPGELRLQVEVRLTDDNALIFDYSAETDADTVVNFTNHSYFNLSGADTVLDHEIMIDADSYLEVNEELIPTGRRIAVEGTDFDFRRRRPIASGKYDHCYILNRGEVQAEVLDPVSGRGIRMTTDQPGMQFYCGMGLGGVTGKNGKCYRPFAGFCLETQNFPDAPNHPDFPDPVLHPGEVFRSRTRYAFFCDEG